MTLIGFGDDIVQHMKQANYQRLGIKVILVAIAIRNGVTFIDRPKSGFCLLVIGLVKVIIFNCLAFYHAELGFLIDVARTQKREKITIHFLFF